jgi:hypothetical protein
MLAADSLSALSNGSFFCMLAEGIFSLSTDADKARSVELPPMISPFEITAEVL